MEKFSVCFWCVHCNAWSSQFSWQTVRRLKVSRVSTACLNITQYYSESKKSPLRFLDIFPKRLGIFSPNFTHLLYVPIYNGLQFFIQSSAIMRKFYAILSATTQFTPYVQNVHHWPKCMLAFSDIFRKQEFLVQILLTYYTFLSTPP